jgi:flagellar basal-body rod protein FlgB
VDTGQLLVNAMKTCRENHRMLANNIANVDTPHYNPRELDFQKTLRNAVEMRGRVSLRETRPEHISSGVGRPEFERLAILSKNDYNKVDLDDQMVKLSENTSKYNLYGSLLAKRFEVSKNMLSAIR